MTRLYLIEITLFHHRVHVPTARKPQKRKALYPMSWLYSMYLMG